MSKQPVAAPLAGEMPAAATGTEPRGTGKFFLALGIILLLVLAIQGYRQWDGQRQTDQWSYNGYEFRQSSDGFWVTRIEVDGQPYNIPFYYHPTEVADILMDDRAAAPILVNRPREVVISVDPESNNRVVIAGVEIARITGHKYNLLNIPTSSALSRPINTAADIPVVTCADAGNGTTVIQFIHANTTAIVEEDSCILILYESPDDSIRAADKFAYRLLRIVR